MSGSSSRRLTRTVAGGAWSGAVSSAGVGNKRRYVAILDPPCGVAAAWSGPGLVQFLSSSIGTAGSGTSVISPVGLLPSPLGGEGRKKTLSAYNVSGGRNRAMYIRFAVLGDG